MAVQLVTVANQVVANLGLDSGQELAVQWCSQRLAELTARAKFRHLRQYGQLFLPSAVQTGTCTITLNSQVVTLDATAIAACKANTFLQWPDGFAGLFFRPQIGTTWYRIFEAKPDGTVILETPFAYDNSYLVSTNTLVQTGVSFYILRRYTQLDPTARQLGVFMCDFIMKPLGMLSQDQMNMMVPGRLLVSTYPQFWSELNSNPDEDGYPKQVEIYPPPLNSVTVHYTFWQNPPLLKRGDYIPPTIDPDVIRTGAMIDAANNMMGRMLRAGDLEKAAFWRNVSNQEQTKWESKIPRAIRNDRGAEDIKFILKQRRWQMPLDWDPNTDAYTNFLLRGYAAAPIGLLLARLPVAVHAQSLVQMPSLRGSQDGLSHIVGALILLAVLTTTAIDVLKCEKYRNRLAAALTRFTESFKQSHPKTGKAFGYAAMVCRFARTALMRARLAVRRGHIAVCAQNSIAVTGPSTVPQVEDSLVVILESAPMVGTVPIGVVESQNSLVRNAATGACSTVGIQHFLSKVGLVASPIFSAAKARLNFVGRHAFGVSLQPFLAVGRPLGLIVSRIRQGAFAGPKIVIAFAFRAPIARAEPYIMAVRAQTLFSGHNISVAYGCVPHEVERTK